MANKLQIVNMYIIVSELNFAFDFRNRNITGNKNKSIFLMHNPLQNLTKSQWVESMSV